MITLLAYIVTFASFILTIAIRTIRMEEEKRDAVALVNRQHLKAKYILEQIAKTDRLSECCIGRNCPTGLKCGDCAIKLYGSQYDNLSGKYTQSVKAVL